MNFTFRLCDVTVKHFIDIMIQCVTCLRRDSHCHSYSVWLRDNCFHDSSYVSNLRSISCPREVQVYNTDIIIYYTDRLDYCLGIKFPSTTFKIWEMDVSGFVLVYKGRENIQFIFYFFSISTIFVYTTVSRNVLFSKFLYAQPKTSWWLLIN